MRIALLFFVFISFNTYSSDYNRKDWKHWIDRDHDCQDTRTEILIERSKVLPVFKNDKKCSVKSGKWDDYYFREELVNASDIDIDHVIPLKHAYDHGGAAWSKDQKREFANDSENLVVTYKKYNRQKGDSDITKWLPIEKGYACRYVKKWFALKTKYELSVSDGERGVLKQIACP